METETILDTDALIDGARIGRFQLLVGVLCATVLFVDGYDTQAVGYIAPQLTKEFLIPREMLGPLFSANLVGILFGYLALAPLSGRFGQRALAISCTALFGALTFLTTTAENVPMLMVYRFLTGVGLGGAIPSAVALTGEYFPRAWRSSSITMIYAGLSLGQLGSGWVSAALLAEFGWRSVLYVGGALPLVLAAVLAVALPESLEFLVNRTNRPDRAMNILRRLAPSLAISNTARLVSGDPNARKVSPLELFEAGRTAGTVSLWVGLFMNLMLVYFFQNWFTTILVDAGYAQTTAILATSTSMVGGVVAAFVIGPLMDRLGPYGVMIALFASAGLFIAAIGAALASSSAVLIAAVAFCYGLCNSGIQKGGNALAIYFYPTALRSTGIGGALGVGRVGAIIGPSLAGLLLGAHWPAAMLFYAATLPMAVGAASMIVMRRKYGAASPETRVPAAAPAQ